MEVIIDEGAVKHRFTNISRIDEHTDPKYVTLYDENGQVLRKVGKGANIQVVEEPAPEPKPGPAPVTPKPAARKRASRKRAAQSK